MLFADLLSLNLVTFLMIFYSCIIRQVCSIAEYLITCKQFISDCDLAYTDSFQIFVAQVIKQVYTCACVSRGTHVNIYTITYVLYN